MLINAGKLEQENLAGSSCDGLIVHQQQLKGTLVTQSYLHTHTHTYTHMHTHIVIRNAKIVWKRGPCY